MSRLRSLLLGSAVGLGLAVSASPAIASPYTAWSCKDAANRGISAQGWSLSTVAFGELFEAGNNCLAGGTLQLGASGFRSGPINPGAAMGFDFGVPGVTVVGGMAEISWSFDPNRGQVDNGARPYVGLYVSGQGVNAAGDGLITGCLAQSGTCLQVQPVRSEALGDVRGKRVAFGVSCVGTGESVTPPVVCDWRSGRGGIALHRAKFTLDDPTPPTASGVGGTLLAGGPIAGVRQLALSAADVGSGVMQVEARLGATTVVPRAVVGANGGSCDPAAAVGGYSSPVPCALTVPLTLSVDTTKVVDGPQSLVVDLWDAAGNRSTVVAQSVLVANATPTATPLPVAGPGTPTAPVVGGPNGGGDLSTAHFSSKARKTPASRSVGYGKRLTLKDKLVSKGGKPIVGAAIDVREAVGKTTPAVVTTVKTDAKGVFSYVPAATASRTVEFAYARVTGSTDYVDRRASKVRVTARVSLEAAKSPIGRGKPAEFVGKVTAGVLPKGGLRVVLETRGKKGWLIGGVVKTDASGRFRWTHRFSNAATYRFRARVLSAPGLSVSPGTSGLASVRIR